MTPRHLACACFRPALLAAGGPTHVADFKMPAIADQAQYLPSRTAAQVIPEDCEGGEPKLDSAPAVIRPLWILGILASSFCTNVGEILGGAAAAMQPGAGIAKEGHAFCPFNHCLSARRISSLAGAPVCFDILARAAFSAAVT